jgi:hypothetical protein
MLPAPMNPTVPVHLIAVPPTPAHPAGQSCVSGAEKQIAPFAKGRKGRFRGTTFVLRPVRPGVSPVGAGSKHSSLSRADPASVSASPRSGAGPRLGRSIEGGFGRARGGPFTRGTTLSNADTCPTSPSLPSVCAAHYNINGARRSRSVRHAGALLAQCFEAAEAVCPVKVVVAEHLVRQFARVVPAKHTLRRSCHRARRCRRKRRTPGRK